MEDNLNRGLALKDGVLQEQVTMLRQLEDFRYRLSVSIEKLMEMGATTGTASGDAVMTRKLEYPLRFDEAFRTKEEDGMEFPFIKRGVVNTDAVKHGVSVHEKLEKELGGSYQKIDRNEGIYLGKGKFLKFRRNGKDLTPYDFDEYCMKEKLEVVVLTDMALAASERRGTRGPVVENLERANERLRIVNVKLREVCQDLDALHEGGAELSRSEITIRKDALERVMKPMDLKIYVAENAFQLTTTDSVSNHMQGSVAGMKECRKVVQDEYDLLVAMQKGAGQ